MGYCHYNLTNTVRRVRDEIQLRILLLGIWQNLCFCLFPTSVGYNWIQLWFTYEEQGGGVELVGFTFSKSPQNLIRDTALFETIIHDSIPCYKLDGVDREATTITCFPSRFPIMEKTRALHLLRYGRARTTHK